MNVHVNKPREGGFAGHIQDGFAWFRGKISGNCRKLPVLDPDVAGKVQAVRRTYNVRIFEQIGWHESILLSCYSNMETASTPSSSFTWTRTVSSREVGRFFPT